MKLADNRILTGNVVLAWDGLRKPEDRADGSKSWNVTAIIENSAPELIELTEIATLALAESQWHGQLPPNASWPIGRVADPTKYGPQYTAHALIGGATSNGVPPLVDVNGIELNIATCGQQLYPGCIVRLILHSYAFLKGKTGITFGLDGLQIIDATAPQLPVAAGMSGAAVAAAFGTGGVAGQAPAPMQPTVPVALPGQGPMQPMVPGPGPGAPMALPPAAPQPVMTAKAAGATYDTFIAQGWTDVQLREQGYIQ